VENARPVLPRTHDLPCSDAPETTVVIPAYEEAAAIRSGRLTAVVAWGVAQTPPAEVLVVDDGSADGTAALAEACGASVLRIAHGGKAAALKAGIGAARGARVLVTDLDQATPIDEATGLLATLAAGADIAVGSRGLRRPGAPFSRWAMSLGHWAMRRALLHLPWSDTQCGFKAFRRSVAVEVLRHLQRYGPGAGEVSSGPCVSSGFDVEFLLVARRMGLVIAEVPVAWYYRDTRRVAKLRDAWRGSVDLLAIALAAYRGAYDPCRAPEDAVR